MVGVDALVSRLAPASVCGVSGDAIMLPTVSGFGVAGSPPPPELHLERASQPPHEELGASPPAAEDLGLSRHFRLEKTGVIVDLRGDEHRLVGAGGVAFGLRLTQAALGGRGAGRPCSLKRLVRVGAALQCGPLAPADRCN